MTPTDIALLGGLVLSGANQIVMPRLRDRHKDRRKKAASSEVSWQSMNEALVSERDKSNVALKEQQTSYRADLAQLKIEHRAELVAVRQALISDAEASDRRYESEIAKLQVRLEACHSRISTLTRELYELGRQQGHSPNPPGQ